jgi:hypothetical protein
MNPVIFHLSRKIYIYKTIMTSKATVYYKEKRELKCPNQPKPNKVA